MKEFAMCEFTVYLNGEKVFEDAVSAELKGGKITLRNILGETKELENCQIIEVNVPYERLLLSPK
jgi:predicted RNA-binding protein